MIRRFSIRLRLFEVIGENEQLILENLRRSSILVGKTFQTIFYTEGVTKEECKHFVERNQDLLFNINTKLTKETSEHCWYLMDQYGFDECKYRYKWGGDVLTGIVRFNEMIQHLKRRENDEDSYSR